VIVTVILLAWFILCPTVVLAHRVRVISYRVAVTLVIVGAASVCAALTFLT
jgi:hypothetical protein